ncbi:MAG: hypothetical protein ACYTDX_10775, partial [Planctomycetota bacterium]
MDSLRIAALTVCLLLPIPVGAGEPEVRSTTTDTGERFTMPVTGEAFAVHRDARSGEKWLVSEDGERFNSVDAAVRATEAGLTPLQRTLHPELLPRYEAGGDEPVRVLLVPREQPLRAIALSEKEAVLPAVQADLAAARSILGRLDGLREASERHLPVGERAEEERRLLTSEEREELARRRESILEAVRRARSRTVERAGEASSPVLEVLRDVLAQVPGATERATSRTFV